MLNMTIAVDGVVFFVIRKVSSIGVIQVRTRAWWIEVFIPTILYAE
jgi:hypothetical protein